MDAKFKATKIKWDVDKEDIEEDFSLPKEIDVPKEMVEEAMEKWLLKCLIMFQIKRVFATKDLLWNVIR